MCQIEIRFGNVCRGSKHLIVVKKFNGFKSQTRQALIIESQRFALLLFSQAVIINLHVF